MQSLNNKKSVYRYESMELEVGYYLVWKPLWKGQSGSIHQPPPPPKHQEIIGCYPIQADFTPSPNQLGPKSLYIYIYISIYIYIYIYPVVGKVTVTPLQSYITSNFL
jgi:hypothetical protein